MRSLALPGMAAIAGIAFVVPPRNDNFFSVYNKLLPYFRLLNSFTFIHLCAPCDLCGKIILCCLNPLWKPLIECRYHKKSQEA